jgi:hypothetical protein
MRRWMIAILCALALAAPLAAQAPDDCSLTFQGSYREAVELRLPDQSGYTTFNNGQAITVSQWFNQLADPLDPKVPRKPQTNTPAMPGVETTQVTLTGFLVAVRFERFVPGGTEHGDNDFHCEIAGQPTWNTDHVVVEVPPGPAYCDARKKVWQMAKDDSAQSGQPLADTHIFAQPPSVAVTGYVFLDGIHARRGTIHYADAIGKAAGRGITGPGKPRKVRGLWEIHPVLSVAAAP